MREIIVGLVAGILFGAGLVISGMADPSVVLGFLTLGPGWNPALAFVMAGALAVTVPGFAWARRHPSIGTRIPTFAASRIDRRLVLGATIFGLGWGMAGYCPGPAVVSAGLLQGAAWIFLPAMVVGAWLAGRIESRF
jgi:uncharacterized protein